MSLAELAAQDQADARERNFERRAVKWCWNLIIGWLVVGAYAFFAAGGYVPAPSWSVIGQQYEQVDDPAPVTPQQTEPKVDTEKV